MALKSILTQNAPTRSKGSLTRNQWTLFVLVGLRPTNVMQICYGNGFNCDPDGIKCGLPRSLKDPRLFLATQQDRLENSIVLHGGLH